MSQHTSVGQVLGAATAAGGGIVALPMTGRSTLAMTLAAFSAVIGLVVLASFISTRVIRKLLVR